MPTRRTLLTFLFSLSTLLLCPQFSHAGMMHEDCLQPFIYKDAAVNVVVLPYRYVGETTKILTTTGQRLSMLIQLDTLLHLRYGSVGAVQMEMPVGQESDPRCEPGVVWQKIMGKTGGAMEVLTPKSGVVMVWGLIYEEGNDIYVKSFARFARREVVEQLKFSAGDVSFAVSPSREIVSFAPQLLERQDIDKIEAGYQAADVVRHTPDESAMGVPVPRFVRDCDGCPTRAPGYYVLEQKDDWIRVRWFDRNLAKSDGWIKAQTKIGQQSLDDLMPELYFVQGAAGYLRYRIAHDQDTSAPAATVNTALNALEMFRKTAGDESSEASGLSSELSSMLHFLRNANGDIEQSVADAHQAAVSAPESGAARNLSACIRIWQDWKNGSLGLHAKTQADQLIAATVLDAHSETNLDNLQSLYKLLLSNQQVTGVTLSVDEIKERMSRINSALKENSY